MRSLVSQLMLGIVGLAAAVGLTSCMGGQSTLGKVQCNSSETFFISGEVPSKYWPSRIIFFEPVRFSGYEEEIYDASISSVLTNSGTERFIVTRAHRDFKDETVTPGSSISLPSCPFKTFQVTVVPHSERSAVIDFAFTLDRSVTIDSTWRLVAVWSDGP